jgi:hypothetical protein
MISLSDNPTVPRFLEFPAADLNGAIDHAGIAGLPGIDVAAVTCAPPLGGYAARLKSQPRGRARLFTFVDIGQPPKSSRKALARQADCELTRLHLGRSFTA